MVVRPHLLCQGERDRGEGPQLDDLWPRVGNHEPRLTAAVDEAGDLLSSLSLSWFMTKHFWSSVQLIHFGLLCSRTAFIIFTLHICIATCVRVYTDWRYLHVHVNPEAVTVWWWTALWLWFSWGHYPLRRYLPLHVLHSLREKRMLMWCGCGTATSG